MDPTTKVSKQARRPSARVIEESKRPAAKPAAKHESPIIPVMDIWVMVKYIDETYTSNIVKVVGGLRERTYKIMVRWDSFW